MKSKITRGSVGVLPGKAPLFVRQRPDETTRTANKVCVWIAETEIEGRCFTATSRYGAVNELARQLVISGISDGPMIVRTTGLRGEMTIRSFHRAARFTHEESATKPVHMVLWESPEARVARITATLAPKQGVKVAAASAAP